VGPRAGLDTEGKILSSLPGIEPRSPRRPAHSSETILTELVKLVSLLNFCIVIVYKDSITVFVIFACAFS
jgi:hypothetical protein